LVVDDDQAMRDLLVQGLSSQKMQVESVAAGQDALARLAAADVDLVITDLKMPGLGGLELCSRIVEQSPGLPVIVMTAFGDYEAAVKAVRAGAYDFMAKPVRLDVLRLAVERAVSHSRLHREVRKLKRSLAAKQPAGVVGESRAMKELLDLVARVAATGSSVLVTGESGTGKELIAKALHAQSGAKGPFVAVNCAAIPEQLLESELFGHEKGAFTDARTARSGLFAEANGGTLFLDEIGELPLSLQPKLLRALQERTVRPIGGRRDVPFDARLVCATHRDLALAVEEGRFRQDLYFRINVIEVPIPPLRARGNDILLLATRFLEEFAARAKKPILGLTPDAAAQLLRYPWPGNVRELANVVERAVALTAHDHITLADLPTSVAERRGPEVIIGTEVSELISLEEMERRYILHVLDAVGGSKTAAARALGVDRTTLWRRLERYGVKPDGAG